MLGFDKQVKKLEKLSVKLEAWRNTKKSRTTPIPVDLATAAVSLEPFLGKRLIEKKLGVNWNSLSNKLKLFSSVKVLRFCFRQ